MSANNIQLIPRNIIRENDKIIGAEIAGEIFYTPEWERKEIKVFRNYIIFLGYNKSVVLITPDPYYDVESGEIKKDSPYWEEKIFFLNRNTLIKKIRHISSEKDVKRMPLGKMVRANIHLFLETNKRNKYIQRLVCNIYVTHAKPEIKEYYEIKFETKKRDSIFQISFPNVSSKNEKIELYVNKI